MDFEIKMNGTYRFNTEKDAKDFMIVLNQILEGALAFSQSAIESGELSVAKEASEDRISLEASSQVLEFDFNVEYIPTPDEMFRDWIEEGGEEDETD